MPCRYKSPILTAEKKRTYPQLSHVNWTIGTWTPSSDGLARVRTRGAIISLVTQLVFPQAGQVVSTSFSSIQA